MIAIIVTAFLVAAITYAIVSRLKYRQGQHDGFVQGYDEALVRGFADGHADALELGLPERPRMKVGSNG